MALLAAGLLQLAAAAAPGAPSPDQPQEVHNVLERFPTTRLRLEGALGADSSSQGIKIAYNASELRASGDWVRGAVRRGAVWLLRSPWLSSRLLLSPTKASQHQLCALCPPRCGPAGPGVVVGRAQPAAV